MKATKISIKEILGIKEIALLDKDYELIGKKGAGKTSVVDAIRYFFRNKSEREVIIREGADEGEVTVNFETGLTGTRKPRLNKTDYINIKEDNKAVLGPEAFLRKLYTDLQLDPKKFVESTNAEQNRAILDLIDFKWDLRWIKEQFGELIPSIDYEQNILRVLFDIQANNGHYYKARQTANSQILHNRKTISDIGSTLPINYNPEEWENIKLAEFYTDIERRRRANREIKDAKRFIESVDGKIRGFDADKEIKVAGIEKEIQNTRSSKEKAIARAQEEIRAYMFELTGLEESRINRIKLAEQEYNTSVAEFKAKIEESKPLAEKPLDETIFLMEEKARTIETMKGYILEYRRMVTIQNDTEFLQKCSDGYTEKIEKARSLPGEILQNCDIPIEGLSIKNGEPRINGLPVSNLSDGEKYCLCIDVAASGIGELNLLLLDGIEKLDQETREEVYAKCKRKGVRFIATRVTDDPDLTILEL